MKPAGEPRYQAILRAGWDVMALAGLLIIGVALAVGPGSAALAPVPHLFPVLVMHAWASARGSGGPVLAIAAFAAGLSLDALSSAPLGFWALLYVTAAALVPLTLRTAPLGLVVSTGAFAVSLAAVCGVLAVCALGVFGQVPDPGMLMATVLILPALFAPLTRLLRYVLLARHAANAPALAPPQPWGSP